MRSSSPRPPSSLRRRLAGLAVTGLVGSALALGVAAPANADPADWPDTISMVDARGMGFDHNTGTLYVADRVERAIFAIREGSSPQRVVNLPGSLMTVAVMPDGDLIFTLDSNPNIYRLDSADFSLGSVTTLMLSELSPRVVHTASTSYIYGLAADEAGTIYYASGSDRSVYAFSGGAPSLLFTATADVTALNYVEHLGLAAIDATRKTYTIDTAALAGVPPLTPEVGTVPAQAMGIAFFDSGLAYYYSEQWRLVKVVLAPPLVQGAAVIQGDAVVGSTLTATPGAWTDGTTFEYEWLRDGHPIAGATGSTYTIVAGDLGAILGVSITGTNLSAYPAWATVAATLPTAVAAATSGSDSTTSPAGDAKPATLPDTGFDGGAGILAAVVAMLGAGLLVVARVRRARAGQAADNS